MKTSGTMRVVGFIAALACGVAVACSSSTAPSPTATPNVQTITVNPGPANTYFNGAFTSVTVCEPGSTTRCQTIDGVLVDTGSVGLRLLASVITVALPPQTDAGGNTIGICGQFQDGFTWGPVVTADVQMAGERAASVPIQAVGSSGFAGTPADCASTGASENTLDTLGANGILGVGLFRQDCGIACTFSGSSNPGVYYSCRLTACTPTAEPLTRQLQNPVWLFASDNNGVVIQLPTVPPTGLLTVSGSLIFGIGTQGDNALGSAKVLTTNDGTLTTLFNGRSYGGSFIDSGSNGFFFLDSATTGLPLCQVSTDFYCPAVAQNFSATIRGGNAVTAPVTFTVGNADNLPQIFTAFSNIAGPNPGSFDFGLSFFYGRTVFTAIEGQNTPGGAGPFVAF